MDRTLIMLKSPNLILAGFGALAKMGEEAGNLEAKKALLVTDKGITASGIAAKVEKVLTDRKISVDLFDQVIPDPDIACCEKCIDTAKAGRYDLIVGVGGGSAMDIASVTSTLCTNPGRIHEYFGINLLKKQGIAAIDYGASLTQLENIHVPIVHAHGVTGAGVIIGMLDDGFNQHAVHPALKNIKVLAEYDFVQRDSNTSRSPGEYITQGNHGAGTLSTVGGYQNGQLIGSDVIAPGVIEYAVRGLGLCTSITDAACTTVTEVYPDSPRASPEQCNAAQVAAVTAAIEFALAHR